MVFTGPIHFGLENDYQFPVTFFGGRMVDRDNVIRPSLSAKQAKSEKSALLCGFVKSVDFTSVSMSKQIGQRGKVVSQVAAEMKRNWYTAWTIAMLMWLVKGVDGNERRRRSGWRAESGRSQQWTRLSLFDGRNNGRIGVWWWMSCWVRRNEIRLVILGYLLATVRTFRGRVNVRSPIQRFAFFARVGWCSSWISS